MNNTLMHLISFELSEKVKNLSLEQCNMITKLAKIRDFHIENHRKPGETLLNKLYEGHYTPDLLELYLDIVRKESNTQRYKPQTKVALLIANQTYEHINKLVVPESDCELLKVELIKLGYTVVLFKNLRTDKFKNILEDLFNVVPKDSYCIVFYAGHGCEISSTKCLLGIECPNDVISSNNCVREAIAQCKDRDHIADEVMPKVNCYTVICCSTLAHQSSEEKVEILVEQSNSFSNTESTGYVKSNDKYFVHNNPYVKALCKHLHRKVSVGEMLNKVHQEYIKKMEHNNEDRSPMKVEFGFAERSLHDAVTSAFASTDLLSALSEIKEKYRM